MKTKKTGTYVNAHDICAWDPKYSIFKELVDGRNYEVFSLFGSRRGNYTELAYSNYGMPDFLKETVFDDYCRECGYYGFIWFKLPDIVKAVSEYSERLSDPFRYLDPDSDEYMNWIDLKNSAKTDENAFTEFMEKYRHWLDDHRIILDKLHDMSELFANYTDHSDLIYDKIVDLNETIFLFFFDS